MYLICSVLYLNSLGKDDHIGQRAVVQIEQVVRLLLGNDQRVPLG